MCWSKRAGSAASDGPATAGSGRDVAANQRLHAALQAMVQEEAAELFIPPLEYCTDNAAMAAMAVEHWRQQQFVRWT